MKKGSDFTGVAVVYYCHDGGGNVLFNKRGINCRDEHGTWDIGGGALELHDSVEETLRKEIKEEYATDVVKYEFLGFRDIHKEDRGNKVHWIALDFKVLVDKSKAKNGEPHKFDEVKWVRLDNMPEPLYSQLPAFLAKYKDRL